MISRVKRHHYELGGATASGVEPHAWEAHAITKRIRGLHEMPSDSYRGFTGACPRCATGNLVDPRRCRHLKYVVAHRARADVSPR